MMFCIILALVAIIGVPSLLSFSMFKNRRTCTLCESVWEYEGEHKRKCPKCERTEKRAYNNLNFITNWKITKAGSIPDKED